MKEKKIKILWLVGITVPKLLMMAKTTCNGPNKNTLFNILPNKTKKWRIKARWTIKAVANIKLQIMSFFRNRPTRKQNKGEQKTLTNVVRDPVKDNREWFKTIEKNDPAKLNINQNKYNLQ